MLTSAVAHSLPESGIQIASSLRMHSSTTAAPQAITYPARSRLAASTPASKRSFPSIRLPRMAHHAKAAVLAASFPPATRLPMSLPGAQVTFCAPKQASLVDAPEEAKQRWATADQAFSHGLNYHHASAGKDGYQFFMPPLSLMGEGALQRCGAELKTNRSDLKHAFIVTDQVLHKIGATKPVTDMLAGIGVEATVFDEVEPNPTIAQVEAGVAAFKQAGADFIISFGGGSPHDAAKAVGIVATNGGGIADYEGVDKMHAAMPPLVAINTTAGTGSELTRFTIITAPERHTKMAIIDWRCTPSLAVNDPSLMVGMPKGLTAATGMDALTHAIEAYVSRISFPVTDAAALHAMRLIPAFLPTAVAEPHNMKARDMMSYAEYLAGTAFNSAGLGYVHAMSHQLGGWYNFAHGVCNAVLLPAVQAHNAKHVPELFVDIGQAMGCCGADEPAAGAVAKVLDRIRALSKEVGIPANLRELGADPKDFDALATNAMRDACAAANPVDLSHAEVVQLFRDAYEQQ